MYYKPATEMIKVKSVVSGIGDFENQYVKRIDYERDILHVHRMSFKSGAEEKSLDYQAAKEKRIYDEKVVLNSSIVHLKLALKKLEECKAKL